MRANTPKNIDADIEYASMLANSRSSVLLPTASRVMPVIEAIEPATCNASIGLILSMF